jgi:hypothetical protein
MFLINKAQSNVLEADQADTRHAAAANQFRSERLGQDPLEGIRVCAIIYQYPPFDDASYGWKSHRPACWRHCDSVTELLSTTILSFDPEKVHDLIIPT